jgi:hypothetical protein
MQLEKAENTRLWNVSSGEDDGDIKTLLYANTWSSFPDLLILSPLLFTASRGKILRRRRVLANNSL